MKKKSYAFIPIILIFCLMLLFILLRGLFFIIGNGPVLFSSVEGYGISGARDEPRWCIFHSIHTTISDGSMNQSQRDDELLKYFDCASIVDHQSSINSSEWTSMINEVNLGNVDGSFTYLFGAEGETGPSHLPYLVMNPPNIRYDSKNMSDFAQWLNKSNGVGMFAHPADGRETFNFIDSKIEQFIPLAEMLNFGYHWSYYWNCSMDSGCESYKNPKQDRSSTAGPGSHGWIRYALDNGFHLGFVGATDYHGSGSSFDSLMIYNPIYTGLSHVDNYTRGGVLGALRSRHTWAAEGKIDMDISSNFDGVKYIMGDIFSIDQNKIKIDYLINSSSGKMINNVSLFFDGVIINLTKYNGKQNVSGFFEVEINDENEHYMFIEVVQNDGKRAFSSPMYVTYKPHRFDSFSVGMNLDMVNYWTTAWPFVDVMKTSSRWIPNAIDSGEWDSGAKITLRNDGYPIQIPYDPDGTGVIQGQVVKKLIMRHGYYPTGNYTLIFEGNGTVTTGFNAESMTFNKAGAYTVKVGKSDSAGVVIAIKGSDVNDPVRNIRFIMPGFENNYENQIYPQLFLDRLSNISVIRFMNWDGPVYLNEIEKWENRTMPYFDSQEKPFGVAYEYMINLSNQANADFWVTIPHRADDDYVRNLARLIKNNLNHERKVYVEYSNEIWNYPLPGNYAAQQGCSLGICNCGDYNYCRFNYQARRSAEIFKIFGEEFGGFERIVKVVGSQGNNLGVSQIILSGLNNTSINPLGIKADALAIAPYFAGDLGDNLARETITIVNGSYAEFDKLEVSKKTEVERRIGLMSVDEIIKMANDSIENSTIKSTSKSKTIAESYGLKLIAYEGGPHLVGIGANNQIKNLTNILTSANRDPRMKDLVLRMFKGWRENGGGLFVYYLYTGDFTIWGSWGALEYQNQSINDAPKYRAIREVMDDYQESCGNGFCGAGESCSLCNPDCGECPSTPCSNCNNNPGETGGPSGPGGPGNPSLINITNQNNNRSNTIGNKPGLIEKENNEEDKKNQTSFSEGVGALVDKAKNNNVILLGVLGGLTIAVLGVIGLLVWILIKYRNN